MIQLWYHLYNDNHSISIVFPHGTFVRKKGHTSKYEVKYGTDRAAYTFLEVYNEPHNFDDIDGKIE